jgi:hypothetical protein
MHRRVEMPASVFGGKKADFYRGVVVGRGPCARNGKESPGYVVRWHDGDSNCWLYEDLEPNLVPSTFRDHEWELVRDIKIREDPVAFPAGWRSAKLYRLRAVRKTACIYFGGEEYEGLDFTYTFVGGVLRDGEGEEIELVASVAQLS